ncbi:MAG: hypothetical protein EXS31_14700 [Pedosphaera sp.]|nr:hypothetical protein [Pedosphaera sp.]
MFARLSSAISDGLRGPWTLLAIIGRELRVASRRPGTYRFRSAAAWAALAVMVWRFLGFTLGQMPVAAQGKNLFQTAAILAFVFCLFSGVRAASDSISEEKREGTLGLLFLTDLTGLDVVLGKLAATSLNGLYGVLAVMPILAVPLVLGGVSFGEFGQMALLLVNTVFFSLAVALLVSSLSRNERKAAFATAAAVLTPTLIPVGMLAVITWLRPGEGDVSDQLEMWVKSSAKYSSPTMILFTGVLGLQLFNPIYSFVCVFFGSTPFPGANLWPHEGHFWISMVLIQCLSWFALLFAARIVPAVWKDRPKSALATRIRQRTEAILLGDATARLERRRTLLDFNPFMWLMGRERWKQHYAWLFVVSMVAIGAWRFFQDHDIVFDLIPLVPTMVIIHGFLKIWVIAESSHRLVEDQRSGALELLLSTPLEIRRMVEGQALALRHQFGWPLFALCGLELIALAGHYSLSTLLLVQAMLLADMLVVMWVSMWLSTFARTLNQVILLAGALVFCVPWVLFVTALGIAESYPTVRDGAFYAAGPIYNTILLASWAAVWIGFITEKLRHRTAILSSLMLAMPWTLQIIFTTKAYIAERRASPRWDILFDERVLLWFLVGMLTNLALLAWARPRLLNHFRTSVLRRFEQVSDDRVKQSGPRGNTTTSWPARGKRNS